MQKYAFIIIISGLLFIPFLGGVHLFDWDEINFAECAREMIVSGDYLRPQIDFMPFWEKPPFFIWMQLVAMKLFGVGAFAARFPNAITGIVTLIAVFYAGKKVVHEKMAMWWVLLFAASWLPHLYFKSGIIDPSFNLFIFLAFFQVHLLRTANRKWLHVLLAGLTLGMAAITKGPVAILVGMLALAVYIISNRGLNRYKIKHFIIISLCALIPALLWMTVTAAAHGVSYGQWFLNEFIQYQIRLFSTEDSDHGGPFIYHFVVLLVGCFPASVFLFQYGRKQNADFSKEADFTRWMWILFWVVLILFSIVKTKIVHYSSLCYFPLTYLAALQLYRLSEEGIKLKRGVKILLLSLGSLLGVVITLLPLVGIFKNTLANYIADPFVVGNLRAAVSWSYAECTWGLLYLIGIWISVSIMGNNFRKGMTLLCVVQIAMIQATILHFTPKVEAYSQKAAINYFKQFAGRDVYVQPLGYKSYANLFYTDKRASRAAEYIHIRKDDKGRETPEANEHWLLYGKTDKPAFFICKIMDSSKFAAMPQLEMTGSGNGFVFFKKR
jgi:4-amino-4-deoxy-L-arabinose transferase-like glycosyltransferase